MGFAFYGVNIPQGKHLALRVLEVGQGDEVIASILTFIGSVTPIVFQEATPVFIDSETILAEEILSYGDRF